MVAKTKSTTTAPAIISIRSSIPLLPLWDRSCSVQVRVSPGRGPVPDFDPTVGVPFPFASELLTSPLALGEKSDEPSHSGIVGGMFS